MIDTPAIEKLLGELERLRAAATPGPFKAAGGRIGGDYSITGPKPWRVVASVHPRHMRLPSNEDRAEQLATADLFAKSANNLPTLITTIRALMEAVEEGRRAARNRDMWKAQCERQADALAAIRSKGDACPSNRPEDS